MSDADLDDVNLNLIMTSYLSINTEGHDEVDLVLDHQRGGVHVQDLVTEMKARRNRYLATFQPGPRAIM